MKKIKAPNYTDEELMRRVWDIEEIKKLVNKRMHYVSNDWRRQELNDLWVTQPANRRTASLGKNWGWYVGMESIERYYVLNYEASRKAHLEELCAADSSVENVESNLGIGCMHIHPPTTGLVRLAYDGKTARGLWYCIAQDTISKPDGTAEARWVSEKFAADLIREDGQWKLWHVMIAYDLSALAGTDYSSTPVYPEPGTDPYEVEFGTPDISFLTHNNIFNWWDNYPAMPEEYFTFSDDMGYGPEGHPGYNG